MFSNHPLRSNMKFTFDMIGARIRILPKNFQHKGTPPSQLEALGSIDLQLSFAISFGALVVWA